MHYIVLDLEWNQPFSNKQAKKQPFLLVGEIIEIGAYKLDDNLNVVDDFKIWVAPKYYKKLQSRVKRITGITQSMLAYGVPFINAVSHFKRWCGTEYVILTWGRDDIPMLIDNLRLHSLDTSWIPRWYNLQLIFSKQFFGDSQQRSLASAVDFFEIETTRSAHDAHNDAYYTSEVCKHLDLKRGISEYRILPNTQDLFSNSHVYHIAYHGFESIDKAFAAHSSFIIKCPMCKQRLPVKGWVQCSATKAIAVTRCEKHGDYLIRIKVAKNKDGRYRASVFLYTADSVLMSFYSQKLEEYQTKLRFKDRGYSRNDMDSYNEINISDLNDNK